MFPDVGSTIVPPGRSFPSRSAASIIGRPIRSFTEPPGLRYSSFASSCAPPRGVSLSSRTIGVEPTSSRIVGYCIAGSVFDPMNVTIVGRGNVGGGLAGFWRAAGHEVQELGRDGGDASSADVVVVAVPGGQVAEALAVVTGLEGKVAIDTTNPVRGRPDGFESLAHQVKSIVGGPTAKAFNTIFARQYAEIAAKSPPASCIWAGDDDARDATERLIRDAGLDPVRVGDLRCAVDVEDFLLNVIFPIAQDRGEPFFYRIGY